MVNKHLSTAQLDFLRLHYVQLSRRDLTQAFNRFYGANKTVAQIKSTLRHYRICSGRTGYFVQGQTAWNHGKKGYMGANVTSFTKGSIPPNLKRLGAERIDSRDGYVSIKISELNPHTGAPTRYKHKHVYVWETAHGPIPKKHVVFLKDGNAGNCKLNNLMLLSRAELLVLNQMGYKNQPGELKPSVLALAQIQVKAGFRTCVKGRKRKNREEVMAL